MLKKFFQIIKWVGLRLCVVVLAFIVFCGVPLAIYKTVAILTGISDVDAMAIVMSCLIVIVAIIYVDRLKK